MKLRITIGIIAAVALAALFSACESEIIDLSKPEAELLSLQIGDIVMEGTNIPVPVNNRDWDEEEFNLNAAEFKTISFKQRTDIVNARFFPTASKGAKVKWGIANRTVRPGDFYDTRVPATFDPRDFLYFQVTSEDGEITNYYRFATYLSSPVKELTSIKVATREGTIAGPADKWNSDTLEVGIIHVTSLEAIDAVVNAVPWADTATLRYAVTPYGADVIDRIEPVFGSNNTFSFLDTQLLYVEVAAENTDINIYCFNIYVGRIATVSKLTFINPGRETTAEGTGTFEALGKGTAKNSWTENSGAGSFASPHQPQEGFTFAVELDDTEGRWQYANIGKTLPGNNASEPTWSSSYTSGDTIPDFRLEHGEYLAIKVIPANRAFGSIADHFYKVKIELLAAEFTVQPKSDVYMANEPAKHLSFMLDRGTESDFTYQWYEANSWYGGYGFDSDGLIGEDDGMTAEAGWGNNDKGTRSGIEYDVSEWHKIKLDEKHNVSLHNGGNMYYNLPTPGRPINRATDATYQPPTDYRPFITNFSNESHYYWVVVTDKTTGLKATSARAVVVTEWGVVYKDGHVVPDDDGNDTTVDKKHHIIDLYAYQTIGAHGLQASPRNPTPFKAGNHGDSYWIPVTFPDGFDIMEYSVFTAQALFFLADGREWIQNWTQGDIGFGKTKEGGTKGNLDDAEEIVLWYNLTNDNATRGLASSGNEPQGSGLSVTPEYIVVKPAGTKPLNQMPPFQNGVDNAPGGIVTDSVGRIKPYNNDNAQGWFTPYIELCELRFEGPTRYEYCDCTSKEDCECKANCDCEHCKE